MSHQLVQEFQKIQTSELLFKMNRKIFFSKLLIFALVLVLCLQFLAPTKINAVAGAEFQSDRIIDDVVFFTPNTMSVNDIQNFLNSKVPVCDTNHVSPNPSYQPPFTCLKSYTETVSSKDSEANLCNAISPGVKNSAQIIYEVAQSCGINPQVLIVLLQKEQGLVTDTWPYSIQYRSATGYGCPDTAACDSQYYGFFNQVYMAARQFRKYAKNPELYNFRMARNNFVQYNPNANCNGSTIYIKTQATAGLYNYTPYQPNQAALDNLYGSGDGCSAYGNRNFWRYFNDWFGSPVIGKVPSPLYKSSLTQTIYVVAGGIKYPVPNFDILANYGLLKYPAAVVDDAFLNQYTTGPTLGNIAKRQYDPNGTIFLTDDGKRYPIDISACAKLPDGTPIVSSSWNIDCFNSNVTLSIANEILDNYTVEDISLPQVIMNNGSVWKIENGKKRRITDPLFVDVLGGWSKARWMANNNASQPEGKMLILNNRAVRFDNSSVVYLLSDSKLYPIPSLSEFYGWGLEKNNVLTFPASYNTSDPIAVSPQSLNIFSIDNNNQKYIMSAGSKIPIPNGENWPGSNSPTQLGTLSDTISTLSYTNIFRSENNTLFTVSNGNMRRIPTPDDFFFLGYKPSDLRIIPDSVMNSLTYQGQLLSPGRLFKVQGSDVIYYAVNNGSLTVDKVNYPGLPYSKIITVDSKTASLYPVIRAYQP